METEVAGEEDAQGDDGNAPVIEDMAGAGEPVAEETAPSADAAAEEGDGGHTAGPEAAGASSAAPAAGPSTDKEQSAFYLEAPNGVFIQVPWGSSSRAPEEGEAFDGEVLASAGLKVVEAPGGSGEPEEEKLLHRLLALYRARQAKLESREALTAKAVANMEKRAAELRAANQAALRDLVEERERHPGSTRSGSWRKPRLRSSNDSPEKRCPSGKERSTSGRSTSTLTRTTLPLGSRPLAGS